MKLGVAASLVGDVLVPGDVEVAGGLVAAVGCASPGGRGIAIPGLVDLQVNGFAGVDFSDADSAGYRRAGAALLETGVTAFCATLITASEHRLLEALREVPVLQGGPRLLGVHLEGPFISPARLGVHPSADRRDPDVGLLVRLLDGGPVRMMTLAPELPGAERLLDVLARRGIVASCGHSDATAEQAFAAFDRGARTVTHLFNAMRPFSHRDPGIAGAALVRDDVVVQLILDGVHVSRVAAELVWRTCAGRVALVTDAMAGAGLGDGVHRIGGADVEVRGGVARNQSGVLAGSTLTLIEAVRNLSELGATLEDAVGAATAVPAGVLGLPSIGRLGVGLPADIVVVNDELAIERIIVDGRVRVAT